METEHYQGVQEVEIMCDKQVYHDTFQDYLDRIHREGERFRKALEGDSDLARMVQEIRNTRNGE